IFPRMAIGVSLPKNNAVRGADESQAAHEIANRPMTYFLSEIIVVSIALGSGLIESRVHRPSMYPKKSG
ncbi:MAG: hypothetical protein CFH02_01782, partial [Alphaproteobacteria bacterium MarineAlpha3_Bin1]